MAMYVLLRVCGKLALAELTDDKWLDVESFLVADRRVRHDGAAFANLEEEEEVDEERLSMRGNRWLAVKFISRLKFAGKICK